MRFTRRECLKAVGGGALAIAAGSAGALARAARAESKSEPSHLGMPGLRCFFSSKRSDFALRFRCGIRPSNL